MNDLIKTQSELFHIDSDKSEQYLPMIKSIQDYYPTIFKDTSNFNKTQSQFMDNVLTVHNFTPLRNIRQCLAEFEKARSALTESHYSLAKKKIEIKMKEQEILSENSKPEQDRNTLFVEMKHIEIEELNSQISCAEGYQQGAIRKVANYVAQIQAMKTYYGVENFDELDFEVQEERHHIMTAFNQAICAARSRGGAIDEGNHIYFQQIGINGAHAQCLIDALFSEERDVMFTTQVDDNGVRKMVSTGRAPNANMLMQFLENVADMFKGCSKIMLEGRGMNTKLQNTITKEELR